MAMNLYQWATQPIELSNEQPFSIEVDNPKSRMYVHNVECTPDDQWQMIKSTSNECLTTLTDEELRMLALFVWFATTDRMEG